MTSIEIPASLRTTTRRRTTLLSLLLGGTLVIGCSNGGGGNAERFCGEVEVNRAALVDPQLTYADDIDPLLELYRSIGELAPLAIEEEWDQLTLNYETAATVIPGDPESEQLAIATALQSEKAAAAVSRWLRENCAVDLGPVSTLVAHD